MSTKLQKIRQLKNISQPQLAQLTGMSVRTIQHYEQGQRDMDGAKIETLLKLSETLNCRISDLIEGEDLAEKLKNNGY